jgi:hypothetical protein
MSTKEILDMSNNILNLGKTVQNKGALLKSNPKKDKSLLLDTIALFMSIIGITFIALLI